MPAVQQTKKAVVFDLFETLITEWGHEKYTKRKMSSDLGCSPEEFGSVWETLHERQYRGEIGFQDSIRYVCAALGIVPEEEKIRFVTEHRIRTKSVCFDCMHPEILPMLLEIRRRGYKLAILSNCSQEEVTVLRDSVLASLADEMILSYETGFCKPQPEIYHLAAQRLGISCEECIFIGDGGSRELYGAAQAGMHPYRAMWYIRQFPVFSDQPEFTRLEEPGDVLQLL